MSPTTDMRRHSKHAVNDRGSVSRVGGGEWNYPLEEHSAAKQHVLRVTEQLNLDLGMDKLDNLVRAKVKFAKLFIRFGVQSGTPKYATCKESAVPSVAACWQELLAPAACFALSSPHIAPGDTVVASFWLQ